MEARFAHVTIVAAALLSLGAGYRTKNFIVQAPTPELAKEIGDAAEKFRRELAIEWTGKEMPQWGQPCMLTARVSPRLGAGGATSFVFERGEVFGWQMNVQGSRQRVLDSVLPHEVTHTIFACHFRQALPRWADEGACTTVEHASEKAKQQRMLITFLKTNRGISFTRMFAMKEYPRDVMPLYSQGYSLARYLIAQGGKRKFLDFVGNGMKDENWPRAVNKFYGHSDLLALQNSWLDWVKRGSPQLTPAAATIASANAKQRPSPSPNLIYRAQSADPPPRPAGRLVPVRRPKELAATRDIQDSRSAESGWSRRTEALSAPPSTKQAANVARDAVAVSEKSIGWRPGGTSNVPEGRRAVSTAAGKSSEPLIEWSSDSEHSKTPQANTEKILDASAPTGTIRR